MTLTWLIRFGLPMVVPDALPYAVGGGLTALVWWGFFRRAQGLERWGALALIVVGLGATSQFLHAWIAKGMMGMLFWVYATGG